MSLKDQLAEDLKDAMRANDESRKIAIRMVMTAVKNAEVSTAMAADKMGEWMTANQAKPSASAGS